MNGDTSSDEDCEIVAALFMIKNLKRKRKRNAPFAWVRPMYQERDEKGAYRMLTQELKLGDREYYFR